MMSECSLTGRGQLARFQLTWRIARFLGDSFLILLVWAQLFQKARDHFREIFRIASLTDIDDWCGMWLRSLKWRCHDNRFLYSIHTIFSLRWPCVINFVHSATTRSNVVSVNTRLTVDDFNLLTTPIHRWTDIAHCERIFPPWTFSALEPLNWPINYNR